MSQVVPVSHARRHHRRLFASLCAAAVALCMLVLTASGASAADRTFTTRFSVNTTGAITSAANTLETCPTATSGCTAAQQTQDSDTTDEPLNNDYNETYVDTVKGLTDSSSAQLNIPVGATVLFAGLYYGARYTGAITAAQMKSVELEVPGASTFQTLTASQIDTSSDGGGAYQGFVNVTPQVAAAGGGSYTVGNVAASTGVEGYAGWSIVVAYQLDSDPARNLTIDDGLISIDEQNATINVGGFQTPPAGTVNTDLGFIAYEGDEGIIGDTASLDGHTLSDATHPANNFFDSAISDDGTAVTTKTPNYLNQFGYDSSFINANGLIPNGATTATVALTTDGDVYYPGVVTFATELYSPKIQQTKTVSDVTHPGGPVREGDVLRYDISGTNAGQDGTSNFTVNDPLPADTTYVPGTLDVVGSAGSSRSSGTQTDTAGDDLAEYSSATNAVSFRLGQGSTATAGGNVAPGASYEVSFEAQVGSPVPQDTVVTNTATASYNAKTLGTAEKTPSSVSSTVTAPDLTLEKTLTSASPIIAGTTATYSLAVSNVGDAPSQGTVTVADTLPSSETATAVSGTGWSCQITGAGAAVSCTRTDPLTAGSAYPAITLSAFVSATASGNLTNTATVSGGGDGNPANNSSSASGTATQQADVALTKTASAESVNVGQDVTFTLTATNNGPSTATSVTLSDPLPTGFVYESSAGAPCTTPAAGAGGTVTCTVASLASGASAKVTIDAQPLGSAAGTTLTNTATVSAAQPDPTPGNNSASASVAVTSADISVTKTLTGDPAALHTGDSVDYVITATNAGPSDTTGATITDPIPDDLSGAAYTAPTGVNCQIANQTLTCVDPTLAASESFAVHLTATVRSGEAGATLSNTATVSSDIADPKPANNSATVTTPLAADADLSVTKTATPDPATPGTDETFTITTRNAGPDAAQDVSVSDPLPSDVTFVSASDGGAYDSATGTVTWDLGSLDDGGTATVKVITRIDETASGTLTNSATASAATPDPDPSNNTGTSVTTIVGAADLELSKTVDNPAPAQGATVTYTLTAKNDGPAQAVATTITDALPAGVSYVSDDDGCTVTGQALSCPVGDLASGASAVVHVKATVAPVATAHPGQTLTLETQKVDTSFSLQAAETQTDSVTCPSGYFVTDGSAEISAVDQGAGTLASVNVLAAYDSGPGTYTVTLQNTATGQAQGHVTAVCESAATGPGQQSGVAGALTISAPQTASALLLQGEHSETLECGAGQTAIDPGFQFDAPATVRSSEPSSDGEDWTFIVDVPESVDATFSIVCLNDQVTDGEGDLNPLQFTTQVVSVSVPPSSGSGSTQASVVCPTGYEGIVASDTLDQGLVLLGNDPQPITRVFNIDNPSTSTLNASLDLLCLADQTGAEVSTARVTNTAQVSSSTQDPDLTNNSASATFTANGVAPKAASPGSGSGSASGSGSTSSAGASSGSAAGGSKSGASSPAIALRVNPASFASQAITLTRGGALRLRITCAAASPCSGTLVALSTRAIRVGGTVVPAGTVLGSGRYHVAAGRSGTVRFALRRRYARVLRALHGLRVTLRASATGVAVRSRRLPLTG